MLSGYTFPKGFLFGWATAAHQWEGAVKADGKGPSIWVSLIVNSMVALTDFMDGRIGLQDSRPSFWIILLLVSSGISVYGDVLKSKPRCRGSGILPVQRRFISF